MCSGLARMARMPPAILRMQGLDAAVEHLGEAGDVGDVAHGDAGFAKQARGAAGGDEFDAHAGEGAGEFDDAGLVGDAEQYTLNFGHSMAR